MYGISCFILIISPLLFQIIFGKKAIEGTIKLKFGTITLISFILQIVLSILSFSIARYNFYQNLGPNQFKCGTGLFAFIILEFLLFILLTITIIIQYFVKKFHKKKLRQLK
ncbi:hypothetical protein B0A62_22135 [Flavobacterium hydatis]|uniref:Uncharacterized protein n=1 Tax=Flavobacterium hydatis TaxID=991 RepID=A0A086A4V9_FLAHY|nr:hypothetical protein IW20_19130 [Flavobacterium hydatis]OXA88433.1 hypothetical protein B0A62_22135 [Flavobacterium hydatis]